MSLLIFQCCLSASQGATSFSARDPETQSSLTVLRLLTVVFHVLFLRPAESPELLESTE